MSGYENWDIAMDAVYLAACALQGVKAEPDEGRDLETLYRFCQSHSITAMVAMALEDCWKAHTPPEAEQVKPWKQAKEKAIRKNILLNAERQQILAHLEQIGCWYMPLKGSLLQHDYPKFGMRQMTDNDILIDPAFQTAVHDYMAARDYTVRRYQMGNHDEYEKQPVYNFEMHTSLFQNTEYPELAAHYADVRGRLRKDPDNGFGYHFSDEDFYVYMTAHAYKHFITQGTGIRNLLDTYVYLRSRESALDWAYIEKELEILGALDYERRCRALSKKLFAGAERALDLTEEESRFLTVFLRSGTHGTKAQRVENALEKLETGQGGSKKLQYLSQRLFLSREKLEVYYPALKKHPWLYPFYLVVRVFRVLLQKPGKILKELMLLGKHKKGE